LLFLFLKVDPWHVLSMNISAKLVLSNG